MIRLAHNATNDHTNFAQPEDTLNVEHSHFLMHKCHSYEAMKTTTLVLLTCKASKYNRLEPSSDQKSDTASSDLVSTDLINFHLHCHWLHEVTQYAWL